MPIRKLPFVRVDETGQVQETWSVEATGDYAADCALGRKHFRALLFAMNLTGNALLLPRVLEGQAARREHWGGIETGFHQEMAEELMAQP